MLRQHAMRSVVAAPRSRRPSARRLEAVERLRRDDAHLVTHGALARDAMHEQRISARAWSKADARGPQRVVDGLADQPMAAPRLPKLKAALDAMP
jgi:hypothetical protein